MKRLEYSDELDLDDFRNIPKHIPYDVIYQTVTSESFSQAGYSFDISPPGPGTLLSRDIWIEYNFQITENDDYWLQNSFENGRLQTVVPLHNNRFALRQGNVVARSTETLYLNINDLEMSYNPAEYIEVLNRLNVSTKQSAHEFGSSGGVFSSGNHGFRDDNVPYADYISQHVPINWGVENSPVVGYYDRTGIFIYLLDGWRTNLLPVDVDPLEPALDLAKDLYTNLRPSYPCKYPFYNPGFVDRINKMAMILRWDGNPYHNAVVVPGLQFRTTAVPLGPDNTESTWNIQLMERIPIPLFKMYTDDTVHGVIPHIRNMKLRGKFLSGNFNDRPALFHNMFCSTASPPNVEFWWNNTTVNQCKMYLKWFVLPQAHIPNSVSMQCPEILVRTKQFNGLIDTFTALLADPTINYIDTLVNASEMTFPALPDVMMIYVHYLPERVDTSHPDDYHLELLDLNINVNASTSKLTGSQSIQYYNLWKQHLQYQDDEIMSFLEWKKYCFVAILKPEDFGMRLRAEYNYPVKIAVRCIARNHWINPTIMRASEEPLGGAQGAGRSLELVVTAVFTRHQITLSSDYRTTKSIEPL